MQLRDSQRAAEDLANELDVVDDQALDTLRADEMFAAWAYIYQQADLYAADVEETLAGDAMKEAARVAARGARDVATTRAEELLGRRLRQYTRLEEFAAWVSGELCLDASARNDDGYVVIRASEAAVADNRDRLQERGIPARVDEDDPTRLVVYPPMGHGARSEVPDGR